MPNSKARNVARKHRKSKDRWKAKNRESLSKIKVKQTAKKVSVWDRAKMSSLSGASPSAVSNPTEGTPRRTASMMTFDELRGNIR
jgi:homoserine kinase